MGNWLLSQHWLLTLPPGQMVVAICLVCLATEDVALVLALLAYEQHLVEFKMLWPALTLGIVCGDILVFGFAYALRRMPFLWNYRQLASIKKSVEIWVSTNETMLDLSLFLSHVAPGSRFLLYAAVGWGGYPFFRYCAILFLSTALWVAAVLIVGNSLLKMLNPAVWSILLIIVIIIFIFRWFARRRRKLSKLK